MKKLFNNRIFRTFIQTVVSSIAAYLASVTIFDIDANAIVYMVVVALSTALSAIMPLLSDDEENKNE